MINLPKIGQKWKLWNARIGIITIIDFESEEPITFITEHSSTKLQFTMLEFFDNTIFIELIDDVGFKDDFDKINAHLLFSDFPDALNAVAEVATFGAKKYIKHGWKTVENGLERYSDAMIRHLLREGEIRDKESTLFHAAHAAWNALARLQLMIKKESEDA